MNRLQPQAMENTNILSYTAFIIHPPLSAFGLTVKNPHPQPFPHFLAKIGEGCFFDLPRMARRNPCWLPARRDIRWLHRLWQFEQI